MKNFKILLTSVVMFTMLNSVFAQNTSIGFRTGATYFTIKNEDINDQTKFTMGLNLAIPIEFQLSNVLSIQPELHFTQKGTQFEEVLDGSKLTTAIKTSYFELPVLIKTNYGTENFNIYSFIAPSIGYANNRFQTITSDGLDKIKTDIDFIDEENAKSQRWEYSAVTGIGAEFKAGIGSFVIDARYSFGLSDNTKFKNEKPDDWKKTTNRGCTLSIGYIITLGSN